MLQQLVVLVAVLAAAAYATWSLAPSRARFAWLSRLDAALARREQASRRAAPGLLRARVLAPLLRRAQPSGGCGSCGSNPAVPVSRGIPRAVPRGVPGRAPQGAPRGVPRPGEVTSRGHGPRRP